NPNTQRISLTNFDVSPKPISLSGNININIDSNTANEHLLDSCGQYRLNITVNKKLLNNWHSVPCTRSFGTCSYDFCHFLQIFGEHLCPPAKSFHSLPTTCACPSGNVDFQSTLKWKSTGSSWDYILNGDFRARVEIMKGHNIVGCLSVEWSMTLPCHGFLCGGR
ncbi:ganglioside GM2 activator, partial [Mytilus galloprovincialis]